MENNKRTAVACAALLICIVGAALFLAIVGTRKEEPQEKPLTDAAAEEVEESEEDPAQEEELAEGPEPYVVRKKYVLWALAAENYDSRGFVRKMIKNSPDEVFEAVKGYLEAPFEGDEIEADLKDDGDVFTLTVSHMVHGAAVCALDEVVQIVEDFNTAGSDMEKALTSVGITAMELSEDRALLKIEVAPEKFEDSADNPAMWNAVVITGELIAGTEYLDAYNRVDLGERKADSVACEVTSGDKTIRITSRELCD